MQNKKDDEHEILKGYSSSNSEKGEIKGDEDGDGGYQDYNLKEQVFIGKESEKQTMDNNSDDKSEDRNEFNNDQDVLRKQTKDEEMENNKELVDKANNDHEVSNNQMPEDNNKEQIDKTNDYYKVSKNHINKDNNQNNKGQMDKTDENYEDSQNKLYQNFTYNKDDYMKNCIKEISHFMKECKDEEKFDCPCLSEVPCDTLTDIFKNYGILCYCMVHHKKSMTFDFNIYIKAFFLETSLLQCLQEKPTTIPEVYFGKKIANNDIDKYVASYKTFYNETKIHINCEQEIESLSYKYYKHYVKTSKDRSFYLDPLLFLLLKRKESERFFVVFNSYHQTLAGLRFVLLLSLFSECCKESDDVLKIHARNKYAKDEGLLHDVKRKILCIEKTKDQEKKDEVCDDLASYVSNSSRSISADTSNLKILMKDESMFSKFEQVFEEEEKCIEEDTIKNLVKKYKIDEDTALLLARVTLYIYSMISLETDYKLWFSEKKMKRTWEESVKKWTFAKENEKDNGDMDNAMILQCSKYMKYEEGYLIFSMQGKKNERCLLKTCMLCLHAYRNTNDKVWIERICDLLRSAALGKMKSTCCAMTDDILEGALDFSEEGREILLLNIIAIFEKYHLENHEDLIVVILRGFFALCSHCKDSKTCDLCYNYTLTIYNKWRESKQGFFFKKSSKLCDDIYSSTLGVCDQSNHCEAFHKICKDILTSNDSVGNNVICRLENYHKKCNCQKVKYSMHKNDKSYCQGLLKHCMCEFKE